jgi:hypothetical protein
MDAHNAQIWIASVVIGIEPKPAQTGGTATSDTSGEFWWTPAYSD